MGTYLRRPLGSSLEFFNFVICLAFFWRSFHQVLPTICFVPCDLMFEFDLVVNLCGLGTVFDVIVNGHYQVKEF